MRRPLDVKMIELVPFRIVPGSQMPVALTGRPSRPPLPGGVTGRAEAGVIDGFRPFSKKLLERPLVRAPEEMVGQQFQNSPSGIHLRSVIDVAASPECGQGLLEPGGFDQASSWAASSELRERFDIEVEFIPKKPAGWRIWAGSAGGLIEVSG